MPWLTCKIMDNGGPGRLVLIGDILKAQILLLRAKMITLLYMLPMKMLSPIVNELIDDYQQKRNGKQRLKVRTVMLFLPGEITKI